MSTGSSVWLQFFACVVLIGVAGYRLSLYGDVIAEKTGLSGTWIGLVLLASVTSLPELTTGISAVTAAGVPNIAVGDALGSCVFNLVLIVLLDFLHRGESVYTRASVGHILSASFGTLLIGVVAFNILLGEKTTGAAIGHVGFYTPLILVLYVFAMRTVYRYEQRQIAASTEVVAAPYPEMTLRSALFGYSVAAAVVVAAGTWLPFIGDELAASMGWSKTFVGTLFVAFATSVPELAVTVAAWRIGALDMAIGNLFGSNLFDIAVIAVDDLAYVPGPLLGQISPMHVMTAVSAMMMNGVAVVGLLYRPATRPFGAVGWASLLLVVIYLLNSMALFLHDD